jgi:CO/xanthine dehydrogenase Mo-binding subunit
MERSDPSLGASEGALPPTAATPASAFVHATGRRLRELLHRLPNYPHSSNAPRGWLPGKVR